MECRLIGTLNKDPSVDEIFVRLARRLAISQNCVDDLGKVSEWISCAIEKTRAFLRTSSDTGAVTKTGIHFESLMLTAMYDGRM